MTFTFFFLEKKTPHIWKYGITHPAMYRTFVESSIHRMSKVSRWPDPPPRYYYLFISILPQGKTKHNTTRTANGTTVAVKNSPNRNTCTLCSCNGYFYFVGGGDVGGEQMKKRKKAFLSVTPHTPEGRYAQGDERRSWIG